MAGFAKIVMALSFCYYTLEMGLLWLGQTIGLHNEIWDAYDFPEQVNSPPLWSLLVGLGVTGFTLMSLACAYRGAWLILNGGPNQDFRDLGRNMRHIAWGLIGFWLGYNILAGAVQYLIVVDLASTDGFDFGWDPLDFDIVFAIIGVVLLAISQTLNRAWQAEDENMHFL
ncbi:hypothetical protein [Ruegeria sp. EL01]|jgi:hypothetical protein|uniref:hypothetical protein n=1 Tax=Ruegeria sp. EL01 TaxID=2107578 RepID=UPI000EA80F74|nr:hypothetical protein [Ruegeria sp. EL01]